MSLEERNPTENSFDNGLDAYRRASRCSAGKSKALGVTAGAAAVFAIGASESEAALVVTEVGQAFGPGTNTSFDIAGLGDAADFNLQSVDAANDFFRFGESDGNLIVGRVAPAGTYNLASRLSAGVTIDATADFLPGDDTANEYLAFNYSGSVGGDWGGGNTGFLGIAVQDGGNTHYGWIEITIDADNVTATIERYAIETAAGVPVVVGVPEPNSLACLAMGAAGLLGWRNRRRKAA